MWFFFFEIVSPCRVWSLQARNPLFKNNNTWIEKCFCWSFWWFCNCLNIVLPPRFNVPPFNMKAYSTSKLVLSCTCHFNLNQIMSLNMKSHWHSPTWTPQRISTKSILLSSEKGWKPKLSEIGWPSNTTPIFYMIWEGLLRNHMYKLPLVSVIWRLHHPHPETVASWRLRPWELPLLGAACDGWYVCETSLGVTLYGGKTSKPPFTQWCHLLGSFVQVLKHVRMIQSLSEGMLFLPKHKVDTYHIMYH